MDLSHARVLVVGATGSIGECLARMLTDEVGALILASSVRSQQELVKLGKELGAVTTDKDRLEFYMRMADIVVTASSAGESIIDLALLHPGAIVCDVARPFDTFNGPRTDVLNIASGEVILPGAVEITRDIGLPRTGGKVWACLAETAAIALSKRYDLATLGKKIRPEMVRELAKVAEELGFALAPLEGPEGLIEEETYEEVRAAQLQPA
jgi:predicted amino acid dehydrogenase